MLSLFRHFVAFFAAAAGLVVIVLWVRSYERSERIFTLVGGQEVLIASKEGRVAILACRGYALNDGSRWQIASYPITDYLTFPLDSMRRYESWLGFGRISNPLYRIGPPRMHLFLHAKAIITNRPPVTLAGSGIIIPYWSLVFLMGTIAALPHVRWPPRISMRAALIVMTFVSLLLGLVSWLDLGVPR